MGPSTLSSWAMLIARTLSARGIDAGELFRRRWRAARCAKPCSRSRATAAWCRAATLAALAVLCREMAPAARLRRVTFTRRESPCRARLREFFGCPLEFGARADTLAFRAADLDAPLHTANAVLVRTNEQLLARYDAQLESGQVADRVRARLARSPRSTRAIHRFRCPRSPT